ncbi:BamA/TamA family outer membrane protein [Roseofilum sp. Guam]|uniref:BamA/TamA family outer membrane protein n=1 Tax=Roseofilum sp. Guam TaxID=2821502 RepID=UPI00298E5F79|nr:BamA/TamA family outer membrane protein [Roseofilum sp. Guam]
MAGVVGFSQSRYLTQQPNQLFNVVCGSLRNVKTMRLSPVWLTLLTSSATLGFVDAVQGQILDSTAETVAPSPDIQNQEIDQQLVQIMAQSVKESIPLIHQSLGVVSSKSLPEKLAFTPFSEVEENAVTEDKTLAFTSLPEPQQLSENSEKLAFTPFSEVEENAVTEDKRLTFTALAQPKPLAENSEQLAFAGFSEMQENAITQEQTLAVTSLLQPQPLAENSEKLAFTPFSEVEENTVTEDKTLAFTSLPQPQQLAENSEKLAFTPFSEVEENAITEDKTLAFTSLPQPQQLSENSEKLAFTPFSEVQENGITEDKRLTFTALAQPQPLAKNSEQFAFTPFSEMQENAITQEKTLAFTSLTQPQQLRENSEKFAFTPFLGIKEVETAPATPVFLNAQLSQNDSSPSEPRVLVAEIVVSGVDGDLRNRVFDVISTQAGRTTTRTRLQEDIDAIFATGFFSNVRATPEDTPLGVRVTFEVTPNPVLRQVNINANPGTDIPSVVPQEVIDEIFGDQYGNILNLRRFQVSIQDLNTWYQENGYILAQVVDAPDVSDEGTVTLVIPEGVIEGIDIVYLNRDGQDTEEDGTPVKGRTREFIVTRQLSLQPGDIFNRDTVQADLQRVFGLGIFQDVNVTLNPGTDPTKVVVVLNVQEQNTGSIAAGGGISSASGLFGSLSYQETNFGGNNQTLRTEVQLGTRDFLFDVSFSDPWIGGDSRRTSYTMNGFRRRSISLVYDGDKNPIRLQNGDRPRVLRTGAGIRFSRPLGENPLKPDWLASLGIQYQRVSIRNANNTLTARDRDGQRLAFHNTGIDDLFTIQFGIVSDRRNNPAQPTTGSVTRFSIEQSIPVTSVIMSRLRGSYTFFVPVKFTNFTEGPQALAFQIEGGATFGDLPPYEAFILGGLESVRGFAEGALGSGRYFLEGTVEYRFPVSRLLGGVLFVDGATNLGSGNAVIGNPSGRRRLPGSGASAGIGVRVNTPLGPIRIDYGFNTNGGSRVHFGIGEKF